MERLGDDLEFRSDSAECLEHLIEWLSDVEDISVRIQGVASIEFPNEAERFYILYDSPLIGRATTEATRRLNMEVVYNYESLSEHAPGLAGT